MTKTTPKMVTVKSKSDPSVSPINNQQVEGDTLNVGTVPIGTYDVSISGDGYSQQGLAVDVQKDTTMTVRLAPYTYELNIAIANEQIGMSAYTLKLTDKIRELTYTLSNDQGTDKHVQGLPYSDYKLEITSGSYTHLSQTDFTLNRATTVTLSK